MDPDFLMDSLMDSFLDVLTSCRKALIPISPIKPQLCLLCYVQMSQNIQLSTKSFRIGYLNDLHEKKIRQEYFVRRTKCFRFNFSFVVTLREFLLDVTVPGQAAAETAMQSHPACHMWDLACALRFHWSAQYPTRVETAKRYIKST